MEEDRRPKKRARVSVACRQCRDRKTRVSRSSFPQREVSLTAPLNNSAMETTPLANDASNWPYPVNTISPLAVA